MDSTSKIIKEIHLLVSSTVSYVKPRTIQQQQNHEEARSSNTSPANDFCRCHQQNASPSGHKTSPPGRLLVPVHFRCPEDVEMGPDLDFILRDVLRTSNQKI